MTLKEPEKSLAEESACKTRYSFCHLLPPHLTCKSLLVRIVRHACGPVHRLELAAHYQNPFPRLYNSAPDRVYKTNPATNPRSRGEVPAYMRSYYAAAPEKKDDD